MRCRSGAWSLSRGDGWKTSRWVGLQVGGLGDWRYVDSGERGRVRVLRGRRTVGAPGVWQLTSEAEDAIANFYSTLRGKQVRSHVTPMPRSSAACIRR